jgi:membrane protein
MAGATTRVDHASIRPSVLWPLVCSTVLAAVMFAAEMGRLYRLDNRQKFGHSSSSQHSQAAQQGRGLEPGRGRHASSPWQIPWRGWKDILWRTYERIGEDRLLAVAAGVVFYGLLAIFPAVTALVSLYGLFAKASTFNEHLSAVAGLLPDSAMSIVQDQVNRLAAKGDARLGFGFIAGLAVALWSANSGMKAILDALNVVYEEKEKRGFIKLNLVSLCFTLAAIASFLLALGAVVIMPIALNY